MNCSRRIRTVEREHEKRTCSASLLCCDAVCVCVAACMPSIPCTGCTIANTKVEAADRRPVLQLRPFRLLRRPWRSAAAVADPVVKRLPAASIRRVVSLCLGRTDQRTPAVVVGCSRRPAGASPMAARTADHHLRQRPRRPVAQPSATSVRIDPTTGGEQLHFDRACSDMRFFFSITTSHRHSTIHD